MKKEFDGNEVTIMTCSNCNTHCKHCYISYSGNFTAPNLYNLCARLLRKYRVLLNGTEILLHPDYFESLQLIGQNFILTNGIALYENPDLIKTIANVGIKYVGMSYHFGIHEQISSVNHDMIEQNIARLKEYSIGSDLRVTITSKNYNLIQQMCDKAYTLGATGIKFTNYMQMGSAMNMGRSNILEKKQIEYFFEQLMKAREKYPKYILTIRRCGSFGKNYCNCNSKFKCTAGEESVVITPELKVYPCFFLAKKGMEIGYVENGKIIIDNPIYFNHNKCLAREINNNGYEVRN